MDPEENPTVEVTVNTETGGTDTATTDTPQVAAAAEAVVIAAETAVTLAEGQAALAIQQAAEIVAEHAAEVAEISEAVEQQDRSLEGLWRAHLEQSILLHQMQTTLADLSSSILPASPEAEETTLIVTDPETVEAMIEPSIQQSTSDPTGSTPTEHSAASGSPAESAALARRRVRRFL